MNNNETHRQNNEKPMNNNGSTHDQSKNVTICRKNAISLSADPRHLVYSRLICMYMSTVHVHICNISSAYISVYDAVFGGYHPA